MVTLDKLHCWSEHPDPLVKCFSGTATYRKVFDVPEFRLSERKSDSAWTSDESRLWRV